MIRGRHRIRKVSLTNPGARSDPLCELQFSALDVRNLHLDRTAAKPRVRAVAAPTRRTGGSRASTGRQPGKRHRPQRRRAARAGHEAPQASLVSVSFDKQMGFFDRALFADSRSWICAQATGNTLELAIGTDLNVPRTASG